MVLRLTCKKWLFSAFRWELCKLGNGMLSRLLLNTRVYEFISTLNYAGLEKRHQMTISSDRMHRLKITRPTLRECQKTMKPLSETRHGVFDPRRPS